MLDQAVLDLTGPDAVAGGLKDIVRATLVPKVALLVAPRQIAGAAPRAGVLGRSGLLVFPVAQKEDWIVLTVHILAMQGHIARHAHRALAALLVDHRHPVARIGLAHAAGARRPAHSRTRGHRLALPIAGPLHRAIAHDVVDLGLSEHLVDHHAQLVAAIAIHRIAHRLTGAHDGLQLEPVLLARLRASFHHGLERSRKQKGVAHSMLLHQFEGHLGTKTFGAGHDGPAKVQRGQQRVHQAACPGPIGRRPKHRLAVAVVHAIEAKPILAAHKAGQIADQRAVRDQRALGRAGCAAGVNEHRRVVGARSSRTQATELAGQRLRPIDIAASAIDADQAAQRRATAAQALQGRHGLRIGDCRHRLAVLQAVDQCLRAKQHRQRHGHRPHLQQRHVGHRGFKALRQHDGHAVATPHAQALERCAQGVGRLLQLPVAVNARRLARAVLHDGRCLRLAARPAPGTHLRNIEVLIDLPAQALVHEAVVIGGIGAGAARHRLKAPYDAGLNAGPRRRHLTEQCTKKNEAPTARLSLSAVCNTTCCSGRKARCAPICLRCFCCTAGWMWAPLTNSWSMRCPMILCAGAESLHRTGAALA